MYWLITVIDSDFLHSAPDMILVEVESVICSVLSSLLKREILMNQVKITKVEYEANTLKLEQRKITI